MPRVVLTTADGRVYRVDARPGATLMRAATAAGVAEIAADLRRLPPAARRVTSSSTTRPGSTACRFAVGGRGRDGFELTAAPRAPTSRLSCQIVLDDALDGLAVHLPATQY